MFRDYPLTGVGMRDLKALYPRYQDPRSRETVGHLHSIYFHIAATMGLAGLTAFAWLFGTMGWLASRGLGTRLRTPDTDVGVGLGVVAGMIGFLVAGLFEWNFGDEELLWLLYVLVGLAWGARHWRAAAIEPPAGPREEPA